MDGWIDMIDVAASTSNKQPPTLPLLTHIPRRRFYLVNSRLPVQLAFLFLTLLHSFQIISRFDFSRYIDFASRRDIYLDI